MTSSSDGSVSHDQRTGKSQGLLSFLSVYNLYMAGEKLRIQQAHERESRDRKVSSGMLCIEKSLLSPVLCQVLWGLWLNPSIPFPKEEENGMNV